MSGREGVMPVGKVATATEPPSFGTVLLDLAMLLPWDFFVDLRSL